MKKTVLFFLILVSAFFFASCVKTSPEAEDSPELSVYTISFVQDGEETKTFTVVSGEDFTDIPAPKEKTGYTVVWDKTENDLKNVKGDIVVSAVGTPNEYRVVFNLKDGETLDPDLSLDGEGRYVVVFGTEYELKASSKKGYNFVCYMDGNGNIVPIRGDSWDLAENVVVNAVFTPKTYVVTLDPDNGESIRKINVTFGEAFDFGKPQKEGYTFNGWRKDDTPFLTKGKAWKYDENVSLKASWEEGEWLPVT